LRFREVFKCKISRIKIGFKAKNSTFKFADENAKFFTIFQLLLPLNKVTNSLINREDNAPIAKIDRNSIGRIFSAPVNRVKLAIDKSSKTAIIILRFFSMTKVLWLIDIIFISYFPKKIEFKIPKSFQERQEKSTKYIFLCLFLVF